MWRCAAVLVVVFILMYVVCAHAGEIHARDAAKPRGACAGAARALPTLWDTVVADTPAARKHIVHLFG